MLDMLFRSYLEQYQPYKSYWNYEDGCVLTACQRLYEASGEAYYADFVLQYLSQRVKEDGSIPSYLTEQFCLDSYNCSKALFFALRLTQDPRYARALDWQMEQYRLHPRTENGFCWHKGMYPHQIWLDGLYMLLPFLAEYAAWKPLPDLYAEISESFAFVHQHLRIPHTGLYRHGWDATRTQHWAEPQSGLSASHWLRGEGWLLMALTDTVALLPPSEHSLLETLSSMLQEAVNALLQYRTKNGLFYQVIDQDGVEGNYTETSGNAMIAYAMLKGGVLGILPQSTMLLGKQILDSLCSQKLMRQGERLVLTDICACAGLGGAANRDGSCAYYLSEPRVQNDPKGIAALIMSYAALLQANPIASGCPASNMG
ncbi:MAG: glycoside hydrolase family 88 protein [Oscillospiraceae bacterium]|nr:glycoside hydrolase family 88 protein [Oscillospiraceae bacterium]